MQFVRFHLAPGGSDETFAVRVGVRSASGRLQDAQRHRTQRVVDGRGENGVTIVHDEPIRGIQWKTMSRNGQRRRGANICGVQARSRAFSRDSRYWENTTDKPVTVTLSSAGFYNLSHEFHSDGRSRTKHSPEANPGVLR